MMMFVAIGGFFGAISRFLLSKWLGQFTKQPFWPTFVINSIGSFMLGAFLAGTPTTALHDLIATGFLGAFTTFSTFSYETVTLLLARKTKLAFLYMSLSTCLGIIGAGLGFYLFSH